MRTTIIRLLLIGCLFVIGLYVAKWDKAFALLTAYVVCYIFEPWFFERNKI